nr:MAG: ORF1 [TTV-like mini virus]
MPWRYPYYKRRWRPRYRRWRFGTLIRRRRRRPYYRVRHYKPKTLSIRQWQPPTRRICYIKGQCCLAYINSKRLGYNSTMYADSTVPQFLPGGGGFAVMKFTLENLYTMHKRCENWWTASNDNLPLCRYLGCTITCYQSDTIDYVLNTNNNPPFQSNKLTYTSCQPYMMLMHKNKVIMPSKQTRTLKKPYKKIHIKPPEIFENKWYFQKDFYNHTLLTIHTAAASLLHTYISTTSESNNISIKHLNPTVITNRDWGNPKWKTQHWPYKDSGTTAKYLYRTSSTQQTHTQIKLKQLCPLTDPQNAKEGYTFEEAQVLHITKDEYCDNIIKYRGNIFMKAHFKQQERILYTTVSPQVVYQKLKTNQEATINDLDEPHKRAWQDLTEPLYTYMRYNPNTDDGSSTVMYLLDNNKNGQNYNPPTNEELILDGFPLWLNIYGFVDFQKRLGTYTNPDTNTILCFKTNATLPHYQSPVIPIDQDFIDGNSPYQKDIDNRDKDRWYPQIQFQNNTINDIVKTGPAVAKMSDRKSEEIKILYKFKFMWGGSPAKMVTIDDPYKQIIYPIPRNEHETTSLQSPAQAFESLLYSFDQRNNQITRTALERIRNNIETKEPLLSITDPSATQALQTLQELLKETEEEKESEKTLLQQLNQQRQQQLQLQLRIIELLQQTQP